MNSSKDSKAEDEVKVLMDGFKDVKFGITYLSAVDHVESLEEHESVEDEGKMSLLREGFNVKVVISVENTTVKESLSEAFWFSDTGGGGPGVFWETSSGSSEEENAKHNEEVEERGDHDLSPDVRVKDGNGITVWCLFKGLLSWIFSSKSKSAKNIHDNIDPEELNRVEWWLSKDWDTNSKSQEKRDVDCDLELEESLDVLVDVSTPHDGLKVSNVIIIGQDKSRDFSESWSTGTHGDTNIGLFNSLDIINTIAS